MIGYRELQGLQIHYIIEGKGWAVEANSVQPGERKSSRGSKELGFGAKSFATEGRYDDMRANECERGAAACETRTGVIAA